jgi:hypothetical protein
MTWEYEVVKIPVSGLFKPDVKASALDRALDQLGSVGWELVSALGVQTGNGATIEIVLMLKRPVAQTQGGPPPLPGDRA